MSKQKIYINRIPVFVNKGDKETEYILYEDDHKSPTFFINNTAGMKGFPREHYEILLSCIIDDCEKAKEGSIKVEYPKDQSKLSGGSGK